MVAILLRLGLGKGQVLGGVRALVDVDRQFDVRLRHLAEDFLFKAADVTGEVLDLLLGFLHRVDSFLQLRFGQQ